MAAVRAVEAAAEAVTVALAASVEAVVTVAAAVAAVAVLLAAMGALAERVVWAVGEEGREDLVEWAVATVATAVRLAMEVATEERAVLVARAEVPAVYSAAAARADKLVGAVAVAVTKAGTAACAAGPYAQETRAPAAMAAATVAATTASGIPRWP
jgi:hypothetical protein